MNHSILFEQYEGVVTNTIAQQFSNNSILEAYNAQLITTKHVTIFRSNSF